MYKAKYLIIGLLLCFFSLSTKANEKKQEKSDSLVHLLSAKSAQLIEENGLSYRKIIGPARFLHNNTYLLCDTAFWYVKTEKIKAIGNVQILQNEVVLNSDSLNYYVKKDLAEFRGSLVQLKDKDNNILRTRFLDYNTKDSLAIFSYGGSMKDKEGQIIESVEGSYDSKIKIFDFKNQVNMFTDSVFVSTTTLRYISDDNLAIFGTKTNMWKDENMLSANAGWYNRDREVFFFHDKVHAFNPKYEAWSDSLYFYKLSSDVNLYGKVQLTDSSKDVSALAGKLLYKSDKQKVSLYRKPVIVSISRENKKIDSVFISADTLIFNTQPKNEVDSLVIEKAKERVKNFKINPIEEYRHKKSKEKEEADSKKEEEFGRFSDKGKKTEIEEVKEVKDTLKTKSVVDTLKKEKVIDSTKISFITGINKAKIYKENLQIVCDSLIYTDLDSLFRLYKNPIIWNEVTSQYSADSIFILIEDKSLKKASFNSNSFMIIEQDSLCYNQVRSTDMISYFDEQGEISRFDALGTANALFYLQENDVFSTVNLVSAKMLSAKFKEGQIDRIYYFDNSKNDAYPVVQLPRTDKTLKGFDWRPQLRPSVRDSVSTRRLRLGERFKYAGIKRPKFVNTDIYFPGYIEKVHRQIAINDSLKRVRRRQKAERDSLEALRRDSLANLSVIDSLKQKDSLAVKDSLLNKTISPKDSTLKDSTKVDPKLLEKQKLEKMTFFQKIAYKFKKWRERRLERRKARWARLDKRDAERKRRKEEKARKKRRARTLELLKARDQQKIEDDKKILKYIDKYSRKNQSKKHTKKDGRKDTLSQK